LIIVLAAAVLVIACAGSTHSEKDSASKDDSCALPSQGTILGGAEHTHKCDGDCANWPPHYGYRYGRWYYGRYHSWGCERGGNKGSGEMD